MTAKSAWLSDLPCSARPREPAALPGGIGQSPGQGHAIAAWREAVDRRIGSRLSRIDMWHPFHRHCDRYGKRGAQVQRPPTRRVRNNGHGVPTIDHDGDSLPGCRAPGRNPCTPVAVYDVESGSGVQSSGRGSGADQGNGTDRVACHQQPRGTGDRILAGLNLDHIERVGLRGWNKKVETPVISRPHGEGRPFVSADHDPAARRGQPAHPKAGRIPCRPVDNRGFHPPPGLDVGHRTVLRVSSAACHCRQNQREREQDDRSCHSDFHHVRHGLEIARRTRPVFYALIRGSMSTLPVSIAPFDGRSVCLFCGSSDAADPIYTEAARAFGEATANAGWRLVYGGGGVGLMGASARAAHAAGGRVVGIMPAFLRSRERLFDEVETIVVTSMHERKQLMYDQSDAFVVAPGGVGTLEEVVELLSWKRLDLHAKPVIFLNINGFWETFFALMRHSVETGFTPPAFLDAWVVCDTVEDAIAMLETAEATPGLKHDQR